MENKAILADYENMVKRLEKKLGADNTTPAHSFGDFLLAAQGLFVQKSMDYDDRYLRGLIDLNARTIWTWEIDKKLDRLRSWTKRGELQVKGEGIRNSVDDIFIYTVQYVAYIQLVINDRMPAEEFLEAVRVDRKTFFWNFAARLNVDEWIEFLIKKGRINEDELLLQGLLKIYMGDKVTVDQWKEAIKAILS